ncbi:L-aspartate oxidase [Syntrophus gentianae]|uniref:L-aspartate oxidase n=1 Tax=Syntrophus gentianae TaxID=43775 RepID=A0A1H7XJN5_9BACT|nr:L-aspartate oxidase [Syntrophus gentianae]SEM33971.1 L-aspartate oxidase [Syntrophus gentianae]
MEIKTDFLVLGSGIAGLSFAIKAAELGTVAIVTKKEKSEANTNYAQGGIAAVSDSADRFEYHIRDTMLCGAGLCKDEVVKFVVTEAPERIKELVDWGVEFTKSQSGSSTVYDLGREGGHSMRRVLHAKDLTGSEIERALNDKTGSNPKISVYENHLAVDLIMMSSLTDEEKGPPDRCLGAYVLDILSNEVHTFLADFVILATGGAGKVYLITTNPDIATADGVAMAYRAGALISNMEFIQFHPTCLYHPEAKFFLISEAVRGEGGILKLKNGEPFMDRYHPMKSLAPRDVVAKAIDYELKKSGEDYVLLDISHRDQAFILDRFPNIYHKCLEFGIDMTREAIPVVPAAHYLCGGVVVNHYGETNIDGLFALGEVSCTGLHGANRLASNSLLEAVVYAHRAFVRISERFSQHRGVSLAIPPWGQQKANESDESVVVSHNWDEIRRCMWNYVGIVRSNKRLERAERRIDMISREIDEYYQQFFITKDLIELRNITTAAKLIVQCAKLRKESRGLHYNIDYPERNEADWQRDTIVSKRVV